MPFVVQKHYGSQRFDSAVLEEIIYRLSVKDKVKELKRIQNLYQSRQSVQAMLSDMNFGARYIHLALLLYEVMADMFEITKYHDNIYDLELITEMLMRLRAKFTEYGDLRSEVNARRRRQRRNENPSSTINTKVASLASEYKVQEADSPQPPHYVQHHAVSPDGYIVTGDASKSSVLRGVPQDDDVEIHYHHQYSGKGAVVPPIDLEVVERDMHSEDEDEDDDDGSAETESDDNVLDGAITGKYDSFLGATDKSSWSECKHVLLV